MILDNEQWLLHDCAHTCVYVHVDVQQVFALDKVAWLVSGGYIPFFFFFFWYTRKKKQTLNKGKRNRAKPVNTLPTAVSLNKGNNIHRGTRQDNKVSLHGRSKLRQLVCAPVCFSVNMSKTYSVNLTCQMSAIFHQRRSNSIRISLN